MIILEGPDGGGKTTLLKQIQIATKLKASPKAVDSDGHGLKDIRRYVQTTLKKGWQNLLFDRFALISGPIYGQFTGMAPPNEVFLDKGWHLQQEARFFGLRPLVIYCLPPLPVIRTNLLHDPTSVGVVGDNLDAIYYAYQARAVRDSAAGMAMIYDYSFTSLGVVMGRIRLRQMQEGIH